MKTRFWMLAGLALLSALLLVGCAKATLPVDVQLQLPIDFLFKDAQGISKANLLGIDIVYLGSAAQTMCRLAIPNSNQHISLI